MIKNKKQKNKTILAIWLSTATFLLMSVLSVLSISEWSFLENIKLDKQEKQQREVSLQKAQKWIRVALTKLSNRTEKWFKNIWKDNTVYANNITAETNKPTISNYFFRNLFTTTTTQTTKEFYFNDIENNDNKIYINTLGKIKLINTDNDMFYPNNHARLFETIKLLTNSYYYKVGYPQSTWIWNNPILWQIPVFYKNAYEKWLLNNIINYKEFWRAISYNELTTILKNFDQQYPNIINIDKYNKPTEIYVTRWELAKIIIEIMNIDIILTEEKNILSNTQETGNITNNISEEIDNVRDLIDRWIINQEFINNTNQIITRSNFISILSNAILEKEWKTITNQNIIFDNSIVDINYNDPNILKILYAKQNGLLDYLLETKRWEKYFYPEIPITKHEVYYIIGTYSNNPELIRSWASDKENINLAELSEVINNNLEEKIIAAESKLWQIMDDINAIIEVKNIISKM